MDYRGDLRVDAKFVRVLLLERALKGYGPPKCVTLFAGRKAEVSCDYVVLHDAQVCSITVWLTSSSTGGTPQADGDGLDIHPEEVWGWGWGIRSSLWETLHAALAAQLPRRSGEPPRTVLPPETPLWYSRGSEVRHVIVELQLLTRSITAEKRWAADKQLAADAVKLVNAALPDGCDARGRPTLSPDEILAAVQAEQQGGPPAADPQPLAAGAAGPAGDGGAGTGMLLQCS